jgi:hypothetical protein
MTNAIIFFGGLVAIVWIIGLDWMARRHDRRSQHDPI